MLYTILSQSGDSSYVCAQALCWGVLIVLLVLLAVKVYPLFASHRGGSASGPSSSQVVRSDTPQPSLSGVKSVTGIAHVADSTHVPKCPTCGSENIQRVSGTGKVAKVALFGIFALGAISKTYKCNNCGYQW